MKIWGTYIFIFRGYIRRGKLTDNILKFDVKMTILEEEKEKNLPKSSCKDTIALLNKNKKAKKRQSNTNVEDTYNYEIIQDLKKIDIFDEDLFKNISNCYLNKSQKSLKTKDEIVIPFNNIKVRVYIYRCLNLSAQDDAADYLVKMAGMSAICRANSYIEIMVGEENV